MQAPDRLNHRKTGREVSPRPDKRDEELAYGQRAPSPRDSLSPKLGLSYASKVSFRSRSCRSRRASDWGCGPWFRGSAIATWRAEVLSRTSG